MLLKRFTACAIVFVFVLLIGNSICPAQKTVSSIRYSRPAELKLRHNVESDSLLIERFYPLGWSKTGNFAYLVEPADEACGCYFARVVIQDLRSDKVLWKFDYRGEESKPETLRTFWTPRRARMFARKLRQYGIEQTNRFELAPSVIDFNGERLTPKLEIERNAPPDGLTDASKISLRLAAPRAGIKTLYEESFKPEQSASLLLDAKLAGTLRSPFEPRAAFVVVETHRGYEGPPHITSIRIVGASLTMGFK